MDAFKLSGWYGRLGNNLIQVVNGLALAERNRGRFALELEHAFIGRFAESFATPAEAASASITERREPWFYGVRVFAAERRRLLQRFVLPHFKLELSPLSLPDDTLVVHLRGGDIFKKTNVNMKYIQPPLAFYRRVIEDHPFARIILVAEAVQMNPCVDALLKLYPDRCELHAKTLAEDLQLILRARHLCFNSVGTFAGMLALLSTHAKKLYLPLYALPVAGTKGSEPGGSHVDAFGFDWCCAQIPELPFILYALDGYIPPLQWKADPAQLALMTSFPAERVRRR